MLEHACRYELTVNVTTTVQLRIVFRGWHDYELDDG